MMVTTTSITRIARPPARARSGVILPSTSTGPAAAVGNTKSAYKPKPKKGFFAHLKERASQPGRTPTPLEVRLSQVDADSVSQEDGFEVNYILVSRELHRDLRSLAELLVKFGTKRRNVRGRNGFTRVVRKYIETRHHRFYERKVRAHLKRVQIPADWPYRGLDDFVRQVVARVPELNLVNNDFMRLEYLNAFECNAYVDYYMDTTFGHQKYREVAYLSSALYYNQRISYFKSKLNYFKNLMMEPKTTITPKDGRRPVRGQGIKMTSKPKKATVFKGQLKDLQQFPLLKGDHAIPTKAVEKMGKHLPTYAKVVVRPVTRQHHERSELIKARTAAKRAAKAGPSETELLKGYPAHSYKEWSKQEDPLSIKVAATLKRISTDKCVRCSFRCYRGRVARDVTCKIVQSYPKCACIITAEQQGDDGATPAPTSSWANYWTLSPFKQIDSIKEIMGHPLLKTLNDPEATSVLIDNLKKHVNSEEVKSIQNSLDNFSKALNAASGSVDQINSAILDGKALVSKIEGLFKESKENNTIAKVFTIILGIICSIPVYLKLGWRDRLLLFSSQLCLAGIPAWAYRKIKDTFFSALPDTTSDIPVVAQSDSADFSRMVGPVSQIVSIGLASAVSTDQGEMTRNLVKTGNIARAYTSVKSFSDLVYTSVEEARKSLYTAVTGLPADIGELEEVVAGLQEWVQIISDTVENPAWMATYMQETANLQIIEDLISQGDILSLTILKTKEGRETSMGRYINKTVAILRKLAIALRAARAGTKDRVLPVSILFSGRPGLGKTHTINQLVVDLFEHQDPTYKANFSSLGEIKFTKAPTSDYYDGYLNHFAYVQDEIFQSTDPQKMVSDCDQVMGLIQESSAPLDMARVEGKGSVYFMSKYVMFTTNKDDITRDLPMEETGAIRRRLHNTVLMDVNPRFLNHQRRLDVGAWTDYCAANGKNSAQPNYARFHVRTVGQPDRTYSYKGLVEMLHQQQVTNEKRFKTVNESQKKVFSERTVLDTEAELEWGEAELQFPFTRDPEIIQAVAQADDAPAEPFVAPERPYEEKRVFEPEECNQKGFPYKCCEKYRKCNPYRCYKLNRTFKAADRLIARMDKLGLPSNFGEVCACEVALDCANVTKCIQDRMDECRKEIEDYNATRVVTIPASTPQPLAVIPPPPPKEEKPAEKPSTMQILRASVDHVRKKLSFSATYYESAKVRTGFVEENQYDEAKLTTWLEKTGTRNLEELVIFNWLHFSTPNDKAFKAALPGAKVTALSEADKLNLRTFLGTPLANAFKMTLRSFIAKVNANPLTSVITFLAGSSMLVFGAMKLYGYAADKDKAMAEATVYDAKKDKGGRPTFLHRAQTQAEYDTATINGFNFCNVVQEPSDELYSAQEQAAADCNWESQMMKLIQNLIHVSFASDIGMSDNATRVRGILVDNDFAILPAHGIKDKLGYLKIHKGALSVIVAIKDLKIHAIGERWGYDDVILVKFPRNKLGGVRPISHLFCTQQELKHFADGWGELLVVDKDKKLVTRHATRIETEFANPIQVTGMSGGAKYLQQGFSYNAPTSKGDCGAPLIRWDPRATGKVLGIHVAGKADGKATAYACCVDREWIEEGIQLLGRPVAIEQGDEEPLYGGGDDIKEAMDIVGYTPQRVRLPLGQTCFVPSRFAEYKFKAFSSAPAIRTATGADSSLSLALDKYRKKAVYVERLTVDQITSVLANVINGPASRKIFTYPEALNVLDTVRSIDLSTSMGFPWSRKQEQKTKYVAYDEDHQQFYFRCNTILDRCYENEEKIKNDEGRDFVFITCLKDEKLPLASVERKKVRIFMICPFDLTLMVRKYFGSFVERIHQLKMVLGVCVGIDPHGVEWGELARQLQKHNPNMFEIDYSNWDRSIPIEFLSVFFDLADLFYQDEHKKIRLYIRAAILNPTYQLKYFRFKVLAGNPSGCPVTTELNSIANLAMTLYVLCQAGHDPQTVFDNSFIATYGDDSLVSTSLPMSTEFFKEQLDKLGMIATGAKKDLPVQRKPINEVQFLKRNFVFYQGEFYAPLLMDSILESLLWVRRGMNQHYNFTQTINNAMVELQQYPPEDVTREYLRIYEFARKCNFKVGVTEHSYLSLQNTQAESESLNTDLMCRTFMNGLRVASVAVVARFLYKLFVRIEKVTISPEDLFSYNNEIDVKFVGVDIGKKVPGLGIEKYYHTGFRSPRWEGEMTFTDRGMALVPIKYDPEFEYPVTITRQALKLANWAGPYHLTRYNCMTWCFNVIQRSGQLGRLPEKIRNLDAAMAIHSLKEVPFFWAEEQSDDITQSNVIADRIQFAMSQEATGGQEVRSISELLGSDTLLASVKWEANHVHDHLLHSSDLPGKLAVVKQFECKLKYVALLRADIRVRVEVSALKLFAGSLIVYWVPCANEGLPVGMKITAKQATGMSHAIVRLPDQPVVEMVIPFTHFKNYVSQTDFEKNEIGTVYIKVLNVLRTPEAGAKTILVKVLANYVNAQAIITTPLTNQSTWVKGDTVYPRFEAKVAREQGDEAEEKSSQGIISGPATTIANIANLVGRIPIFSSIASSVSVMSQSIATVAEYMGLSKPRNLQATQPTTTRIFPSVGYADAQDNSTVLGLFPKNSVVIQPSLFGSLIDQMSIDYLVRIPTMVLNKDWTNTHVEGKTLMIIPVHPMIGSSYDITGKLNPIQLSYMGYVASCFKMWRGSIKFRIEIVATDLHSGSIIVGFIPRGTVSGDNEFAYETTLKQVIELTGYTTAEIEIPFISTVMLNDIGHPFSTLKLDDNSATGTLVIKVEKPLIASGVVNKTVTINIWVSAGEDFQLHLPSMECLDQYSYTGVEKISEAFGLRATVGARPDLVCGEQITSIRQLLKVATLKFSTSVVFSPGHLETFFPAHTFTGEDSEHEAHDTYYSHLMRLYRFSRGSIRHKLLFGSMEAKVSAIAYQGTRSEYEWSTSYTHEGAPWTTTHAKLNPTLEYEIPFYHNCKMEVHGEDSSYRGAIIQFDKLDGGEHRNKLFLYESVGDDFSAGYLMGPPTLYQKRTPMFKLLNAIAKAKAPVTFVDGYYTVDKDGIVDVEVLTSKAGSKEHNKIMCPAQKFYYVNQMPQYLLLVADFSLKNLEITDVLAESKDYGFNFSKAICFIRKDDVYADSGSYSYNAVHSPFNAIWMGVQCTSAGLRMYLAPKAVGGYPRNVKKVVCKSDYLRDALHSNIHVGRIHVSY